MAVFGLGAFYDNAYDMTEEFINNGVACIGWAREDAEPLHQLLQSIKIGDLIYIKAHPPTQGLILKGIGIVVDNQVFSNTELGQACIQVRWVWSGNELIGRTNDRYPVRNITLYEEYNPEIIRRIVDLLLS